MAKGIHPYHPILNYCNCFLVIIILVCLTTSIESKVYTVGDDDAWNSGINYQVWSLRYNFSVGDVLAFDYVKGQHNAIEVTEDAFRSCDTEKRGAVIERYESGNDKVALTEAREYWFVCDISGHCLGGMKFSINVFSTNNNTNNDGNNIAPNPGSTTPDSLIPPPTTNGVVRRQAWINYVIIAFGISMIIIPNWW